MKTRDIFNALQSVKNPDDEQLLMLALILANTLVLALIFISNTPGIRSLWFIPALGILLCAAAVVIKCLVTRGHS